MRFLTKPKFALAVALASPMLGLTQPATAATKTAAKLQSVATTTSASKTITFGVSMSFAMNVGGKSINAAMKGGGQVDRERQATKFTLDMSDFMKAIASGSGQSLPPALSDPTQSTITAIAIGPKVWMSYPLLNTMLGGTGAKSKPWVALDAAQLGVDAGDLAASQGADPTQGLDLLAGLSDNAQATGTETVDGVTTTKYRGTITTAALTKNLPKAQVAEATALMGSQQSIPVTVWVDDQNRARRMDLTFRLAQQGTQMTMNASYTFSKFGEPVSITPPPASQVGDNPTLTNMLVEAAKAKKKAA
jgi:LppX_LprAFG lipoprotein